MFQLDGKKCRAYAENRSGLWTLPCPLHSADLKGKGLAVVKTKGEEDHCTVRVAGDLQHLINLVLCCPNGHPWKTAIVVARCTVADSRKAIPAIIR